MPHDGATAIVVVLNADNVVEKEAFVEEVEKLYRRLMDIDPGTSGVEQCHIQHGHVVTWIFPAGSSKFSHTTISIHFICYFVYNLTQIMYGCSHLLLI